MGVWNECVYGCMNDLYKERAGVGNVTLMTRVTGSEELQSENVRLGSVLVVHDGVGMAHMGHPFAPYLSLGARLSRPIDSGSPLVSPGGDPVV